MRFEIKGTDWGLKWRISRHMRWMVLLWCACAQAHGGGLDSQGCHTNRKTGDYHCHGQPRAATYTPLSLSQAHVAPMNIQGKPAARAAASTSGPPVGETGAYRNCAAARAAGAAPIKRGQPGYGPHLDRDNDGVACEPYRKR